MLRKSLIFALMAGLAIVDGRSGALAQGGTASATGAGEVRAIQPEAGNLTIDHGPLLTLDIPASTRVFSVQDRSMLAGLKVGDTVWFSVDRAGSELIISRIATRPDEHGDH